MFQTDHVLEKAALAAAGPAHDHEDFSLPDPGIDLAHHHISAISHGQVANLDLWDGLALFTY